WSLSFPTAFATPRIWRTIAGCSGAVRYWRVCWRLCSSRWRACRSRGGFPPKFFCWARGGSVRRGGRSMFWGVASGVGVFYSLRVILAVFGRGSGLEERLLPSTTPAVAALLAVLSTALVWLGVFPGPLLDVIHAAVRL